MQCGVKYPCYYNVGFEVTSKVPGNKPDVLHKQNVVFIENTMSAVRISLSTHEQKSGRHNSKRDLLYSSAALFH